MSTIAYLTRVIRRDVPILDALELRSEAPWHVTAYVSSRNGHSYPAVVAAVSEALDREIHAACVFTVRPFEELESTVPSKQVPLRLQAAALANEQMRSSEYLAGVVRAVPSLTHLQNEPGENKRQVFLVADHNGQASPAFVEEVRSAVEAITYAGAPIDVEPLPRERLGRVNALQNAGFLMPRRTKSIVHATEADEAKFMDGMRGLVDKGQVPAINYVDDFEGSRLFATPSFDAALPLPSLLAYYDRVYVEMPLVRDVPDASDYYKTHFRVTEEDFYYFAKAGKVIPIFRFNFGNYAENIAAPWLERLDLPFITPRNLDLIAARFLWTSNPLLRMLRQDATTSRVLRDAAEHECQLGANEAAAREFLKWNILAAVSFEGIIFHRGTLALANLSSGSPIAFAIANSEQLFASKATAQIATIETFGAVENLALAQAFNASLCEGMLLNASILEMVVSAMVPQGTTGSTYDHTGLVHKLERLVPALELHFAADVPAPEYVSLFDQVQTRRIRALVAQLLAQPGTRYAEEELREAVQALNHAVDRIRRNAVEISVADVVGSIADVASSSANGALATAMGGLKTSLASRFVEKIGGSIVEETRLGDKLDSVRDLLNGVPAGSVRVYKLRRKLGR